MGNGAEPFKKCKGNALCTTGAIICPFKLTIALAENANVNGVEFAFDIEVKDIQKTEMDTR